MCKNWIYIGISTPKTQFEWKHLTNPECKRFLQKCIPFERKLLSCVMARQYIQWCRLNMFSLCVCAYETFESNLENRQTNGVIRRNVLNTRTQTQQLGYSLIGWQAFQVYWYNCVWCWFYVVLRVSTFSRIIRCTLPPSHSLLMLFSLFTKDWITPIPSLFCVGFCVSSTQMLIYICEFSCQFPPHPPISLMMFDWSEAKQQQQQK